MTLLHGEDDDHADERHRQERKRDRVRRPGLLGIHGGRLLILAGQIYRSGLMQFLWTRFYEIGIPMDGLKIGEQLSWLSKAAKVK
ncbi:DUF6884 domain-containing protein [Bradyrhizobium erythrophlei]|uniref:DUF6884 domain-containing protein n=1 Tax=Bradyrhizobium erythrophlei TaxID=1437360 RepID=UPI003CC7D48A